MKFKKKTDNILKNKILHNQEQLEQNISKNIIKKDRKNGNQNRNLQNIDHYDQSNAGEACKQQQQCYYNNYTNNYHSIRKKQDTPNENMHTSHTNIIPNNFPHFSNYPPNLPPYNLPNLIPVHPNKYLSNYPYNHNFNYPPTQYKKVNLRSKSFSSTHFSYSESDLTSIVPLTRLPSESVECLSQCSYNSVNTSLDDVYKISCDNNNLKNNLNDNNNINNNLSNNNITNNVNNENLNSINNYNVNNNYSKDNQPHRNQNDCHNLQIFQQQNMGLTSPNINYDSRNDEDLEGKVSLQKVNTTQVHHEEGKKKIDSKGQENINLQTKNWNRRNTLKQSFHNIFFGNKKNNEIKNAFTRGSSLKNNKDNLKNKNDSDNDNDGEPEHHPSSTTSTTTINLIATKTITNHSYHHNMTNKFVQENVINTKKSNYIANRIKQNNNLKNRINNNIINNDNNFRNAKINGNHTNTNVGKYKGSRNKYRRRSSSLSRISDVTERSNFTKTHHVSPGMNLNSHFK